MALRLDRLMKAIERGDSNWPDLLSDFHKANTSLEMRGLASGFALLAFLVNDGPEPSALTRASAEHFFNAYSEVQPTQHPAQFALVFISILGRLDRREEACRRMAELREGAKTWPVMERRPARNAIRTLTRDFPWLM